jgi:uncharacterized protein YbjT (DUF2867 family)
MEKTALVIGATGLVGSTLVKQLLDDKNYNQIVQFVRTPSGINHPKLIEYCINFADSNSYQDLVKGDILYSAFGTTLKVAGSKEKQYQIDVTFVENFCKVAKSQGVESWHIVSSIGASPKSTNFYLRMKGQLEEKLIALKPTNLYLLRPSILDGNRKEKRTGEKMGLTVMRILSKIPFLKKYQPIHAKTVARALRQSAVQPKPGVHVLEMNELFTRASKM